MNIKLATHPNPQIERKKIEILDGVWDFGFKKAKMGFKFSTDEKELLK